MRMFQKLSGRKVLVTGAGGFIGANLLAALIAESAEVYALVRETTDLQCLKEIDADLHLMVADLTDFDRITSLVGRLQPDYVFHLAVCRDESEWRKTLNTNVTGTLNLFNASNTSALKKFVHCGSSLEYGRSDGPLKETAPCRPADFYGASRAAAVLFLKQAARAKDSPVTILRLFHVYGPFESAKRLISSAIRAALDDSVLPLTELGLRHDYVFVEDVVSACMMAACAEGLHGEIFNIGSGAQWTNEEVVAEIGRIMGKPIQTQTGQFRARDWDRRNWVADISAAGKRLGWKPEHDLTFGLEKTIDWMQRHVG